MSDIDVAAIAVMVVVTVVATMIWTRAQKRRVDPQREVLDFDVIVQRFYADSDVTPADVERTHTRISDATGVPAGALRPGDRFDRELKARDGWEYDDPIYIFSDRLARDAAAAGVAVKLEEVATVGDAVHLMKRIHDARTCESDVRSLLVKTPIVVIDGTTADLFESVAHAERYLEPPDVEDLLIFDADGLRLRAHVVDDEVSVFFHVKAKRPRIVVRPIDPPQFERERMEDLLRHCLEAASTESIAGGDIMERAIRVLGITN